MSQHMMKTLITIALWSIVKSSFVNHDTCNIDEYQHPTRDKPLYISPDKVTCGFKNCPKVTSVIRIIWEDNRYKSIPSKTTQNGFQYRLNPELICQKQTDGTFIYDDQCRVVIYPQYEFTFMALLACSFVIVNTIVLFTVIISSCDCSSYSNRDDYKTVRKINRRYSYDNNSFEYSGSNLVGAGVVGGLMALGAAAFGGMGDGDHNDDDYD